MHGGERSLVAGVHGLEHVQGLAAANLADDDPVRAHAQGVADQIADGHLAASLDVGRARFQAHHMGLLQRELGGVLNGDDALALRNHAGQGVEEGGLAGAGSARDEDAELRRHQRSEKIGRLLGQAVARHEIRELKGLRETTDRDCRPVQGEWRDDDIDALASGEAGVHHGARFVHTAIDRGDDAIDELVELGLGGETGGDPLDPSGALDEDVFRAIDHDLGDGVVRHQRFEDAEADGVIDDPFDEPCPLPGGQDRPLQRQEPGEYPFQPRSLLGKLEPGHFIQVDLLKQADPVLGDEILSAARHVALLRG